MLKRVVTLNIHTHAYICVYIYNIVGDKSQWQQQSNCVTYFLSCIATFFTCPMLDTYHFYNHDENFQNKQEKMEFKVLKSGGN